MTVARWLRRIFHRPPTVADCIRAARQSPCEPRNAPVVVTGPDLPARIRELREEHHNRYRDDDGFPTVEWHTEFHADHASWQYPTPPEAA